MNLVPTYTNGIRHYLLDGRSVHTGDRLEMDMGGGEWRTVKIDNETLGNLWLSMPIAGGVEYRGRAPLGAQFRWPFDVQRRAEWRHGETVPVRMMRDGRVA